MQAMRKSKRVSWASNDNLRQTRLFLSEDAPVLVGLGAEDHLQAKTSWASDLDGVGSDDNLPPGFEGIQPVNALKNILAQIPIIKWKPPPKFLSSPKWLLVSGEESKEVDTQNQREMRMLEAIYPRPSAIPSNQLLDGAEESSHDDRVTLVVPITEDEEEEDSGPDNSLPSSIQDSPIASGMEPHLVAAAQAALGAALSDSSQGNLIDRDILMSILSDPQMVAQLINNVGATSGTQNITAPLVPMPNISNASLYPPIRVGTLPGLPLAVPLAPAVKDANYYKSLIKQHGEERQDNLPQFSSGSNQHLGLSNNSKVRESKHKVMRPCMFYNTARGCRNGTSCPFQHDSSSRGNGIPEMQQAKRVKMDGDISGT